MAKSKKHVPKRSLGQVHQDLLFASLRAAEQAPSPGARNLPCLTGLEPGGVFTKPQENVLAEAIDILIASKRVYLYGNAAVLDTADLSSAGRALVSVRRGGTVEPGAAARLGNLMVCRSGDVQFPPPRSFTELLLHNDTLNEKLPRVQLYSSRPVFDRDFKLCGAGWYADSGILVHGPQFEPGVITPAAAGTPALSRLPIHLRTLLAGFCFHTDADLVNTLGLLLTGVLINHFIERGKPIGLIDGNQPSVGKTILVRAIAAVLDALEPYWLAFCRDEEELQKRLCSKLRGSQRSVLLIDNCKSTAGQAISSPFIESSAMAPELALRILGQSVDVVRPNDLLWTLTMNNTKVSPDLVSRGLPIQLFYEGRAEDRQFEGPDPVQYAQEHRLEILGELAGMVVHWNQQGRPGRPDGSVTHRCHEWARIIGGILLAAGFPEFLGNAEIAQTFDSAIDELAALAEAVIAGNGPFVIEETPT